MIELAHLRNRLAIDQFSCEEKELTARIRRKLETSDSIFKDIVLEALRNALTDVDIGEYKSATRELQLIHNFPVDKDDTRAWDENHFYRIELLSYIEDTIDTGRVKKLIIMLASMIKKTT